MSLRGHFLFSARPLSHHLPNQRYSTMVTQIRRPYPPDHCRTLRIQQPLRRVASSNFVKGARVTQGEETWLEAKNQVGEEDKPGRPGKSINRGWTGPGASHPDGRYRNLRGSHLPRLQVPHGQGPGQTTARRQASKVKMT